MFTIKHYVRGGDDDLRNVYEAHTYSIWPSADDGSVGVEMHGANLDGSLLTLTVRPGQNLFIENSGGNTVERIRVMKTPTETEDG